MANDIEKSQTAFPEFNPSPVMSFSVDGGLASANHSAHEVAAAIRIEHLPDLLPRDYAGLIQDALETGRSHLGHHSSIGERIFSWSFIPHQEIKLVYVYGNDITDRVDARNIVRETESLFDVLWDNTTDAILCIEPKHLMICGANSSASKLLGYSQSELLRLPYNEIVIGGVTKIKDLSKHNSSPVEPLFQLMTFRARDGKEIQVECSFTIAPHQELNLMYIIARDITERLKDEEALRQRTEQLRQSQKMDALGKLASGVAHDFNNHLAAIIGFHDLLLMDPKLEPGIENRIKEIGRAANRAKILTKQMLTFSRRQQSADSETVDVNAAIVELQQMLERLLDNRYELITDLAAQTCPAKTSRGHLEQVIMNLVVNARDAMPDGGQIHIRTTNISLSESESEKFPDLTAGPYVSLAVSDSGIGMDPETQAQIFEPFFTTKQQGEGTGLGLATVYGIIRQNKGAITVNSEVGVGTTFTVYLPKTTPTVGKAENHTNSDHLSIHDTQKDRIKADKPAAAQENVT